MKLKIKAHVGQEINPPNSEYITFEFTDIEGEEKKYFITPIALFDALKDNFNKEGSTRIYNSDPKFVESFLKDNP